MSASPPMSTPQRGRGGRASSALQYTSCGSVRPKMRARSGLVIAFGFVFVACAAAACSSRAPGWHVERGFLRAPDGRAVILRGVNLSGSQKNAPYLDGKTTADYERVRADWGMNAIRFIMTWSRRRADRRRSTTTPTSTAWPSAWLGAVAGLVVVLDMHEDVYGEGFGFDGAPRWTCDAARYAAFVPATPWFLSTHDPQRRGVRRRFLYTSRPAGALRRGVASRRRAAGEVARGGRLRRAQRAGVGQLLDLRLRARSAGADVRRVVARCAARRRDWVAFLEPSSARNAGIATSLPPFAFADVVYAPHSYDSTAERRQRLRSGAPPGQILDNVGQLRRRGRRAAARPCRSASTAASPTIAGIVEYMTAQYDAAGAAGAGSTYWAYDDSDGYGLVAPDGSEKPALIDRSWRAPIPRASPAIRHPLRLRWVDLHVHRSRTRPIARSPRRRSSWFRRASTRTALSSTAATARGRPAATKSSSPPRRRRPRSPSRSTPDKKTGRSIGQEVGGTEAARMTPEFSLRENSDVVPSAEKSEIDARSGSRGTHVGICRRAFRRQIPACLVSSRSDPPDLLISL